MIVCLEGEIFEGSVDASRSKKTSEWMATKMSKIIDKIGLELVVQICTDNTSNMKSCGCILMEKYPQLYYQGCCAHVVDLILEDMEKQEFMKTTVEAACDIVECLRNSQAPLAIFRSHEADLVLLYSAATQFATNFIMVDRFITLRKVVELTVLNTRWNTWSSKLPKKLFERSRRVKACVLKESFWKQCQNIITICESPLCYLRRFDRKSPMMGETYFAMHDLEKAIYELCCAPFNMPSAHHVELVGSFHMQWTMIRTDLHYVGATLNPRYARSLDVDTNEVRQGFLSAITRLLPNLVERTQACKEYLDFKNIKNGFEMLSTFEEGQFLPHKWLKLFGSCAPTLKPIAMRLLSQICSASSCERN